MRKSLIAIVLAACCGLPWTVGAQRQNAGPADWLTDGGDVQRSGWQRHESTLTKDNVKNLKIVWKLQLDNQPREMHSLLPPLIVGRIDTPGGPKKLAVVAGSSDNIYAIDVQACRILGQKHFEYPRVRT